MRFGECAGGQLTAEGRAKQMELFETGEEENPQEDSSKCGCTGNSKRPQGSEQARLDSSLCTPSCDTA